MIKCMIVGSSAERLAKYVRDTAGGTVDVQEDHIFMSFTSESEKIKSSLIRVNKVIYLIDQMTDIRSDLSVMYHLLDEGNAFFKTDEIHVFCTDNEVTSRGISQFEIIMSELKFSNYKINVTEDELPFSELYRHITDQAEGEDKTSYNVVYRRVRAEESKVGYEPEDTKRNIVIKEENRLKLYDKMKEASIKAETGRPVNENAEKELPKINLEIEEIDVNKSLYKKNIYIVSGNPKAGTSVFCSNFAISVRNNKDCDISLIDISSNYGSARHCIRMYKDYTLVDNEKLLTGHDYSNKKLAIYNSGKLKTLSTKIAYLKYYLSVPNRVKSDYIIIDCDLSSLDEVISLCGSRVVKVYITAQEVKDEVLLVKPSLDRLKELNIECMLYLNNSIKFDKSFSKISAVTAREIVGNIKVIEPTDFSKERNLSILM